MATETAVNSSTEIFKQVYSKEFIDNLMVDVAILQRMVNFDQENRLGLTYQQAVLLTAESGCTYVKNDAYTSLNQGNAAVDKQASVAGCSIYFNGLLTRKAIAASQTSKAAFKRATALKVTSLLEAGKERLEWELLYGSDPRGLGIISGSPVVSPSTRAVITLASPSYSPGLWSGKTGTQIDVYDSGGTKINTVGPLTVVTANVATSVRTVTVDGAAADIAALATGQILWFLSQRGQSCVGLQQIAATTTGTLFGIDVTTYDLFKGNTYAVGGTFTYDKAMAGISGAVARGLTGDATLFLSTATWKTLAAEVKNLQQFIDGSQQKKAVLGPENEAIRISYQRGVVKVMSHPLVRIEDGLLFQDDVLSRIGSTDWTFDEQESGEMFFTVPNTNYRGIILMSDQALFCARPARTLWFSGITE